MKKLLFVIVISISTWQINNITFGQDYMPGVTQETVLTIDSKIKADIHSELYVKEVLNVDSSLGLDLGPRWPDVGIIEDPYNQLSNSFIFTAQRNFYTQAQDSVDGIIGIFKEGQIIWHSGESIKVNQMIRPYFIWSVKDINRDGKVEIMSTWLSRNSYNIWPTGSRASLMFLYILSWDGSNGIFVHNFDNHGNSKIAIDENGFFRFADLEGDGIWEIQGYAIPENSQDSIHINENNSFVLRTYSWNNQFYDRWLTTPQPFENDFYPKDKLEFNIYAVVQPSIDSLEFSYSLTNLHNSLQDIQEMALKLNFNPTNLSTNNKCWGIIFRSDTSAIYIWTSNKIHCYNFIKPGETKSLFNLITTNEYIPTISNFYASGWNTDNYDYYGFIDNSKQGYTIAPTYPSASLTSLIFIDTLFYYTIRSFELGWITNQTTADKYDSLFNLTKLQLQQNKNSSAKATLQTVLQEVDIDSTDNLTSEAYALLRYNTEYLLEQIPQLSPNLVVNLKNSLGNQIPASNVKYYESSWKDAVNNGDGTFTVITDRQTVSIRVFYEYASNQADNVPAQNNSYTFTTVNAAVQLKNSLGNLIDVGTVQYYSGAWRSFGTTENGIANKELLPINYSFRMTYEYGSIDKQQDISVNPTVVFQTVNAAVQLKNSLGNLIDVGTVQYYAGAWRSFGTTSNGVAYKELLPVNYSFRMTYEFVSKDKQQNLSTNPVVDFTTVLCTVKVSKTINNQPINNATVKYYAVAWRNLGTTNSSGIATKELLPANLSFRATYGNVSQDKQQDIGTNSLVEIQLNVP